MTNWIYWKYDEQFDRQQKLLDNEQFSNHNKRIIKQFQNHLFTKGVKQARVTKLTWGLRKLCNLLKTDLDKTQKADIERIVSAINRNKKYAESTKCDYKRCLKQFYNWFEDEDPRIIDSINPEHAQTIALYKYLRKYVKTTAPRAIHSPGDIITDQNIQTVIDNGCRTEAERAFLKLLHETGCRIGELLTLQLKDIQQKEPLWIIHVDGKTGERPVFIRYSIPYLARWLDVHPSKHKPDAWLWESTSNRFIKQPLRYTGAQRLINRCFKRANVQKRHNPHWFRHSRATLDAPHYTESIRNKKMGWVEGSDVARQYTHMSGTAVEDAMLQNMGIKKKEEAQTPQPEPCRICTELNPPEARFCWKCGTTCSLDAIQTEHDYLTKALETLPQILDNPELRKKFEEKLSRMETE